jgi:hypothetical protein
MGITAMLRTWILHPLRDTVDLFKRSEQRFDPVLDGLLPLRWRGAVPLMPCAVAWSSVRPIPATCIHGGCTFRAHGEKIYNVIVHFKITQEPPHSFIPIVGNLGLLFETGTATLSDVQEILGD